MGYLKFSVKDTKREVFGMPIPGSLITADIREASYYQEYLANVTKHRRFLAGQTRSVQDSYASKPAKPARKPKATAQKDRINILQYLITLHMCKDFSTKMMKMFLLVENLRQQNPNNYEMAACSSLRSLKSKRTIESRAKRSSKNNLSRTSFQYACFFTHCENEDGNPARANIKQALVNELTDAFGKPFEVLNNVFVHWVFNSLVHSSRALSALRRSSLRTGSTAVKPCQGYSSEFYLITGSIHTDQRGTVTIDLQFSQDPKSFHDDGFKPSNNDGKNVDEDPKKENECKDQENEDNVNSTNDVNTMDVKSNFLYRKIEEEVYVCQPPGFEDPDFSDRVYKVEKALYELHQAPRAWKELCNAFERLMHEKAQMSSMGELTFFFGLQNNYGLLLWPIPSMGKHKYMPGYGKKVIISEASIRIDLQFADEEGVYCLPNSIIIEQLALMSMGRNLDNFSRKFVMYPRFIQVFLDNQIDGISNHERKYVSSSHTKKIFGNMRRIGKGSAMPADPHHIPTILQPSSLQPQKTHKPTKHKRKDTQVPHLSGPTKSVVDEAVYKELDDSLVSAATNASSLKAEQDNGNILQSDEDRLKLNELIKLCTNLQTRVLDLEKTKTILANKIDSLNRRVKKQRRSKSRTHKLKRLYNVSLTARVESLGDEQSLGEDTSKYGRRIDDIDVDEDITLVSVHDDADKEMFDADKDLGGEEVFVEQEVTNKEKIDEVTLAQALAKIKTSKPKVKRVVIQEPSESTTTTFSSKQKSQDKGKAKMVEEPVKPKKKEQIRLDEVALKLQAEFAEEERLQKVDDDKETKDLKQLMKVIPEEEEVAIDVIPLAVKSLGIVDWKIHKEGKKSYYQIIRAYRSSKMYLVFNQMLKSFDKEDLEDM
nr:ribonuclease H-like domain-containing protein [Tanacetum cinerariifolium]GEX69932.1 ribonuclease H-like domain-containing protein [Tanacetum cinerariifolium]